MASDRVIGVWCHPEIPASSGSHPLENKKTLRTVEFFSEFFFFVRMESSLVEDREQIPVMVESWIRCELEELVERYGKYCDLLTSVSRYLSLVYTISSDIVVYFCMDIVCAMIGHPLDECVSRIPCLFAQFTQSTYDSIFIWRVERSSRQ